MGRISKTSQKRIKRFFSRPFYFVLFSLYPVLALLSINISQVHYSAGIRPLIVVSLAAILFFLLFRVIYRNWHRAAFAIAMLSLLFYSYGHLYAFLARKWEGFSSLTLMMSATWSVLAILVLVGASLPKFRFKKVAAGLNIIALGLTVFVTAQVIWWSIPHPRPARVNDLPYVEELHINQDGMLPDIYYIILDSYGRADVLQSSYGYDNSDFINSLEQMGFYVATCSQSNYARTDFSLASSLNMGYIPDLDPAFTPELRDPHPIWEILQHSSVRQMLEAAGYKTIAIATGFNWSQLEDADVYLEPPPLFSDLTAFEIMLLQTTPARHLTDSGLLNLDEIAGMRFRERTLFTLEELTRVPAIPGPKFVFVHIIAPHPPFVFGVNGEKLDPAEYLSPTGSYTAKDYRRGYLQVIPFINSRVEIILPEIIDKSSVPPIIILQADHGVWALSYPKRIQILNAYYMPGHSDLLYPSISPVNSFRILFNSYFGMKYPLLADESFSAPRYEIYDFSPVAYNKCNP